MTQIFLRKHYKIRATTKGNPTGDNYSLTVPYQFAKEFMHATYNVIISGTQITYTPSGAEQYE